MVMTMYDAGKIITGLVIAIALLLFPLWYNAPLWGKGPAAPDPKLAPKAQAAGECVAPLDYMRRSHMQVLDDWRNKVVRDGQRLVLVTSEEEDIQMQALELMRGQLTQSLVDIPGFGQARNWIVEDSVRLHVGGEGKLFEMSLQNTCMNCHTSKEQFCDQCHNYASVSPFCWDCHVEPEEKE